MNKLEVGMYVRTETGEIGKITNFDGDMARVDTDKFITYKSFNNEITTASHNIIDLIEAGDYVNGLKITSINEPSMANCNKRIIYAEDEEGYLIKYFDENDIKSIVTKQQFESMEYSLER